MTDPILKALTTYDRCACPACTDQRNAKAVAALHKRKELMKQLIERARDVLELDKYEHNPAGVVNGCGWIETTERTIPAFYSALDELSKEWPEIDNGK